jgi:hypothetical protein
MTRSARRVDIGLLMCAGGAGDLAAGLRHGSRQRLEVGSAREPAACKLAI